MSHSLAGGVAVVTGAASGIGRALANRCAREDMKVVLADSNTEDIVRVEDELRACGAKVLSVHADVSKRVDVEALAARTTETFGAITLLFNNAGVMSRSNTAVWESPLADWEWVLGVNLWGVIHGIRTFVPIMLKQGVPARIVNTASGAGLTVASRLNIYTMTKHAVVSLSESLYAELKQREAKISVSVLCPGWVRTRIGDADRPRQGPGVSDSSATSLLPPDLLDLREHGMEPPSLADEVFRAFERDEFYIIVPREAILTRIKSRTDNILEGRNPTP